MLIKRPWLDPRYSSFSINTFKWWRLGSRGSPPLFEGPEYRRVGHKTILYDTELLDLFLEHLGNPDREKYRQAISRLIANRNRTSKRSKQAA